MFNLQSIIIFEFYAHFDARIVHLMTPPPWGQTLHCVFGSKIKERSGVALASRTPDLYFLTSPLYRGSP